MLEKELGKEIEKELFSYDNIAIETAHELNMDKSHFTS